MYLHNLYLKGRLVLGLFKPIPRLIGNVSQIQSLICLCHVSTNSHNSNMNSFRMKSFVKAKNLVTLGCFHQGKGKEGWLGLLG